MSKIQAAGQIVVSFRNDELLMLAKVDDFCRRTGATKAGAVKLLMRAAMGDKEAQKTLEDMEMSSFSVAAPLVALDSLIAFA